MKKAAVIIMLFFDCPGFGQSVKEKSIFTDTSLYFIHQIDSLRPVNLLQKELMDAEFLLIKAVKEFNQEQQQYTDSLNPKKKKRRQQALQIDINQYLFRLVPTLNNENQKGVWISGDCKDYFIRGKKKRRVYDPDWKRKFIDGQVISDGGSCFIYLHINLTLKKHYSLTINGST
jgi:hypothetical protein